MQVMHHLISIAIVPQLHQEFLVAPHLASSPVSPIFSMYTRKEGEPGIQNHVCDVRKRWQNGVVIAVLLSRRLQTCLSSMEFRI